MGERAKPGDEVEPGTGQSAENLCPCCSGTGKAEDGACPECDGTGIVTTLVGDA
jgi:DnaJ-class molecular chaperone